jgi:hypothetical protein
MAHVEKNVFQSKDQTTLAIVLAAIDELDPGDLVVVADAWARKRDQTSSNTAAAGASARVVPMEDVQAGSTGSQPIESPRVLDHVGKVENAWVYEDDASLQMLDHNWIDILNKNDGNLQSFLTEFTFTRKLSNESLFSYVYDVDIDAMTSTNEKSKKARALHRMQLRVLGVKDMLEAGSMASFSALTNDGWTMQWQFQDFWGWKNMTEASNHTLLNAFTGQNASGVFDEWQIQSSHILHFAAAVLSGRPGADLHNDGRPLRLVALRVRYKK